MKKKDRSTITLPGGWKPALIKEAARRSLKEGKTFNYLDLILEATMYYYSGILLGKKIKEEKDRVL